MSKANLYNNDMCLINFSTYLFSSVKFFWIQLTLKIYYCQEFPNLRYFIASVVPVLNTETKIISVPALLIPVSVLGLKLYFPKNWN